MSNNEDMENIVARHSTRTAKAKAKPTEAEAVNAETVGSTETANADAKAAPLVEGGKIRRKPAELRKERRVSWNIEPVLYARLKATADKMGLPVSAFVGMAVRRAIEEHERNSN